MKNLLITGVPRSGTSLLTKLLSNQEDVLCFSEPRWLRDIRNPDQSAEEFATSLLNQINTIRENIKKGNPVTITVKKGSQDLPDNYFKKTNNGYINLKEDKEIFVEYSANLTIVTKSNTLFTSCLNELIKLTNFDIYAMTRDPLYTLLSWRSLDIPISRGELKIGEIYSEKVRSIVKEPNILKRQVLILNWFLNQFEENKIKTFKYEDLIHDSSTILSTILKSSSNNKIKFCSKNSLTNYNTSDLNEISKYLSKYLTHTFLF